MTLPKYSFETHRDVVLKTTDELKVNGIEYTDLYILEDYKGIDKDEFYKRFGLYQLVDTTLKEFDKIVK